MSADSVKQLTVKRAPTKRQRVVLRLIAEGKNTPKQIALELGITHTNACMIINRMVARNLVRKSSLEVIV